MSIYGEKDINFEACTTGKFVEQGGIDGRTESTGLGVYYGIRELLNDDKFAKKSKLSKGIQGKTFAVQGFGNVGYWASKFLHNDGGKITTIIEHDVAIYKKNGFNPDEVEAWKNKHGTLKNYAEYCDEIQVDNPALFMERDVDILIPAAVEKSVHKGNAKKIQAKVIAEAANGPTTFAAE